MSAPDHERFVDAPGARLYVRIDGALDGERLPLVMLHGGPGGSHYAFIRALPLAARRALILYDQRGCGRSDGIADLTAQAIAQAVADLEAVRTALGIARWHVFGHSWGATIALAYAAGRPPALAGLILSSPLVSTRAWLADAAILVARLPAAQRAALADPAHAASATATDAYYDRFYMRRPRAADVEAYRAALPRCFSPDIYHALWGRSEFVCTGTLATFDGEPLLDRIDGRTTLFVTGRHDEARPATVTRFARRAGARLAIVRGAGHSTLNDDQPRMLALIGRFLARQDARAARCAPPLGQAA